MLFQLQRKMGNRWCVICKEISGRTENMVKNRWYSSARKKWYAKKGLKLDLSKKAPKLPRKKKPTPKKKTKPRKKKEKKKKTKKKINKSEENTMYTMSLTLDDDDLISFPTTKTGSLEPQNNTKAVIDFLQMGGGDKHTDPILPSPSFELLMGSPSSMLLSPSQLPPFSRHQQHHSQQQDSASQMVSPHPFGARHVSPSFSSNNTPLLSPTTQQALWSMELNRTNSGGSNSSTIPTTSDE